MSTSGAGPSTLAPARHMAAAARGGVGGRRRVSATPAIAAILDDDRAGASPMRRPTGRARRLATGSLVPATRAGRQLAVIAVVDSVGSGMFLAGSALYFTRVIGLSAGEVGVGLSLAGAAGFVAAVPVGMVADRLGAGWVYVALQLWRALGYAGYCVADSFTAFVLLACAIGLADTAVLPVGQSVVAAAVSADDRLDTLAKVRAVRNIGFAMGALLATGAIGQGSRAAFVFLVAGNAVSFAVTAVLLWGAGVPHLVTASRSSVVRARVLPDARYVAAAGLNGVLAVHLTVLPIALPLWISQHTTVPTWMVGACYLVNTVMAVGLQARFARRASGLSGAIFCAVLAGASMAGLGVAAYLLRHIQLVWLGCALTVVAVVLLTCGELWQSASGWAISYTLAPPDRRTQYLATFHLGTSLQTAVAPWLLTTLVLPRAQGWLMFAATVSAAGVCMALVVDRGGRHRRARRPRRHRQVGRHRARLEPGGGSTRATGRPAVSNAN